VRHPTPGRTAAIAIAAGFHPGDEVRVFVEPLDCYGSGRAPFTIPGRVVGADVLSGSTIPTGRVVVEVAHLARHAKTAVRGGERVWTAVPARPRRERFWPWDLQRAAVSSGHEDPAA
jgi:hypothetical protein